MKNILLSILLIFSYVSAAFFIISGFSTQGRIPQIMGLLLIIIGNQIAGLIKSK